MTTSRGVGLKDRWMKPVPPSLMPAAALAFAAAPGVDASPCSGGLCWSPSSSSLRGRSLPTRLVAVPRRVGSLPSSCPIARVLAAGDGTQGVTAIEDATLAGRPCSDGMWMDCSKADIGVPPRVPSQLLAADPCDE